MVNPLSAVTQGFISNGSHVPLLVSVQGLLIFTIVPVSTNNSGGSLSEEGDEQGGRFRKRKYQTEDDEILIIVKAWLTSQ